MKQNPSQVLPISTKIKLIYNPHAGTKRRLIPNPAGEPTSIEDLKQLFMQYELPIDAFPTQHPGHATTLAKDAEKEGYKLVVVAGGDGTVGEAVNGLAETSLPLGIIPLGSVMNVARMLSIPNDLEKAVQLIKLNRMRKIDLGMLTMMDGKKLEKPYYFLESAGFGLEAQFHEQVLEFERGNTKAILNLIKTVFDYYNHKATITMDSQTINTRATLVTISNGPLTGAALKIAPTAKLNDHKLTVSIFRMDKMKLIWYVLRLIMGAKKRDPKISTYTTKTVKVETKVPRLVHADARVYTQTPIEMTIAPNSLHVITGYPKPEEDSALIKKTYIQA